MNPKERCCEAGQRPGNVGILQCDHLGAHALRELDVVHQFALPDGIYLVGALVRRLT
jgi:hypothetical protein